VRESSIAVLLLSLSGWTQVWHLALSVCIRAQIHQGEYECRTSWRIHIRGDITGFAISSHPTTTVVEVEKIRSGGFGDEERFERGVIVEIADDCRLQSDASRTGSGSK
jgi:hypothetical protein